MLAIEEEDSGRDEGDVKVLGVHRNGVCIHNVDVCHLGECMLVLGQLRKQQEASFKDIATNDPSVLRGTSLSLYVRTYNISCSGHVLAIGHK